MWVPYLFPTLMASPTAPTIEPKLKALDAELQLFVLTRGETNAVVEAMKK